MTELNESANHLPKSSEKTRKKISTKIADS